MQQAEEFRKAIQLLDPTGEKFPDLLNVLNKVPEFQKQLEQIANTPEEFNNYYSERGWIAYESMESKVIESAIELARVGRIDDGESVLVEYYHPEKLKFRINYIRGVKEFEPRMRLIDLALDDYIGERFHACVPVLLMMIDGTVNDVTKDFGLFAENVDISAWDSISGHENGLGKLSKLLSGSRKKTNADLIAIPYRNGILHGKELAYDNIAVAAKTWALLFAVRDWIVARRKQKPKEKAERTIEESIEDLRKIEQSNKLLDKWIPRKIVLGVELPKTGTIDEYEANTPERATMQFLFYWTKKNFGKMSEMIVRYENLGLTNKKIAGELREAFETLSVISYELLSIDDQAPAVTEVKTSVTFSKANVSVLKELNFRWIYMNRDATNIGRWERDGSWFLIDNFRLEVSMINLTEK